MKKRSVLAGWLCSYILIMMIPIVTVFVNYAWSMKVIRKEILEANNLVLDNLGDEIDRYLNREMAFESYLLQNRNFLKVISSRKKESQFYKDVAELINHIRVYDSDMSCLIYLKHLDYVIDNSGANESHYLYGGMRVGISDMIAYEDWVEELSGTYRGEFLFGRYLHYGTGEDRLVYAQSIDAYSRYEEFNLFVGVPVSLLEELTKSLPEGTRLLMGIEGETALALSSQGTEENWEECASCWGHDRTEETEAYMVIHKASGVEGIEYCLLIPKEEFWRELRQVRNVLYVSVAVTLLVGIACMSMALRHNFRPVDSLIRKISGGGRERGNEYKLIEDAYFKLVREKDVMHRHMAAQAEDMQGIWGSGHGGRRGVRRQGNRAARHPVRGGALRGQQPEHQHHCRGDGTESQIHLQGVQGGDPGGNPGLYEPTARQKGKGADKIRKVHAGADQRNGGLCQPEDLPEGVPERDRFDAGGLSGQPAMIPSGRELPLCCSN